MHAIDWGIIGVYVAVVTAIGFIFIRRASGGVAEYFVAGRNLPWWLAGTSLVATSFAADTPLFVAGLIATSGIAGNFIWWQQVIAWGLGIIFFARLWRRAGLLTDAEFIELRYGGRSAAFLRGFKALYTSVIFSTCTLAWVMLAMQKIVAATLTRPEWLAGWQQSLDSMLGLDPGSVDLWKWFVLLALFGIATFYTALSGFWGIVVTDLFQFIVAMAASFMFAIFALDSVGGMAELKSRLLETFGAERAADMLRFIPSFESQGTPWPLMTITVVAVYLSMAWWTDCGGFAAQRMFSTRSEKDSVLAAIWYSIAHFALRPWPWIIVGLVAAVYYPTLDDPESGYPRLMLEILPTGLLGVMVASLLAAFMSTVDTHLNWNASYFVTDIYKRFIAPDADEARCVKVSRWSVVAFAALAISIAYFMTSIQKAVIILFSLQAGIGLVLILRWFWWRINACSEIAAMVGSLVFNGSAVFYNYRLSAAKELGGFAQYLLDHGLLALTADGYQIPGHIIMAGTVILTTPVWVAVTFLTKPADPEHLDAFYRKVRPARLFWKPIARRNPEVRIDGNTVQFIVGWLAGVLGLYAAMFAIGKFVLLEYTDGLVAAAICVGCAFCLWLVYRGKRAPLYG